jgi:hypothetical protein
VAPRTIEEYVRWVLAEDHTLDGVDPEVKKQLEADYVQALETEITAALVNALPPDQLAYFEKMLEHSGINQVQGMIEEHVPDAQDIIAGILLRFRTEYLSADDVV